MMTSTEAAPRTEQREAAPEQLLTDLRALEALFAPGPHTWTQEANARDSRGNRTLARDENAACFCIEGAVQQVTKTVKGVQPPKRMPLLYSTLRQTTGKCALWQWNDAEDRTYEDVMTAVRKTITNVEEELEHV